LLDVHGESSQQANVPFLMASRDLEVVVRPCNGHPDMACKHSL
jgi:hypothetical protein